MSFIIEDLLNQNKIEGIERLSLMNVLLRLVKEENSNTVFISVLELSTKTGLSLQKLYSNLFELGMFNHAIDFHFMCKDEYSHSQLEIQLL